MAAVLARGPPTLPKKRVDSGKDSLPQKLAPIYSIEQSLLKNKSIFYIYGDKIDKILANQLKGSKAKLSISKIQLPNGHITMDHRQINEAFRDFYAQLYSLEYQADCDEIPDFLNDLGIPGVSADVKKMLEEPISQAEIALAISSMQSGKCPGPDGFPAEFFKKFSSSLSPLLCSVLSESHVQGFLPPMFTEACVTLIAKKGKDLTDCASYRPISLPNTDAKILAKVLANRLESVLPKMISKDQTGFIKGRQSYFNIRRLFNIIYTAPEGTPECVLSLDAEI